MQEPQEPQAPRAPSALDVRNELVRWARDLTNHKAATRKLLDAGRGTPNWIATTPREAFFMLGQFALEESKRVWDEPDLGGLPRAEGIAERLRAFLTGADDAGADLLRHALDYGVTTLRFDPDAFIHDLVGGVVGDNYPVPARMLEHAEVIVRRYLAKTMCAGRPPEGAFDLFAVEGGTAALGYVFRSLLANNVLRRGDTIACGTPSAAPALELEELALTTLTVSQSETVNGRPVWQYPDSEIAKLEDPKVKAFFLVNPGNPGSCALRQETVARIVELVRTKRPDLLLVTDDVYGPFVEGFRSLAAELPRNTILVYSFSKAFGCTGWRLGVVALHERNVIDEALARLPDAERELLRQRYGGLERDPDAMKFLDRMVADSRGVALSPTAGLSPPQQIQMTLFALFALLDVDDEYQARCRSIIRGRFKTLFDALGVPTHDDPLRAGYYAEVDLAVWGHRTFGDEFTSYVEAHPDPLEIILALARRHGVVLRSGRAFDGPPWVARVSLANLDAEDYAAFGRELKESAAAAVGAWRDRTRRGDRLDR